MTTLLRSSFPARFVATHDLAALLEDVGVGPALAGERHPVAGADAVAVLARLADGEVALARETVTKDGERSPSPWQSSHRISSCPRMSGAS